MRIFIIDQGPVKEFDVVMLYVLIVLEAPLELYARYSDFIMRCPLAVRLHGFSSPTSDCRWMDCNQIHREMNSSS